MPDLFSIVTPSFRQLGWLKRCVRSVADQEPAHEHIIQDAGTGEELEQWVRGHSTARLFVEKDRGMYDAVNKGFARAEGNLFAYLNCDEQYLPGSLAAVQTLFEQHPEVDLIAGDYLIVDAQGELLSYHRATPLRRAMILTDHLYNYTCGLFYRRSLWERVGGFRPELRDAGDAEWVCRALAAGARTACLKYYVAAFALTGGNMSLGENATAERLRLRKQNPLWMRLSARALREYRHMEKALRGGYTAGAITYSLYDSEGAMTRSVRSRSKPSSRHPFTRIANQETKS